MKRNLGWLIALLVLIAAFQFTMRPKTEGGHTTLAPTPDDLCQVDLVRNEVTGGAGLPIVWTQKPAGGRALAKITLDPRSFKGLRVTLTYGDEPKGFSFNVADSATCNGYGGDSGTQSNDCEVMVQDFLLSIWGSDHLPGMIEQVPGFPKKGEVVEVVIRNQFFAIGPKEWNSTGLFALAGQADKEGPVNYDVYVGFNQVVAGGRVGTGLTHASLVLER